MNWYRQAKLHDDDVYKQHKNNTCGPATVRNILSIVGVDNPPDERVLETMLATNDLDGTYPQKIEAVLKQLNVPFRRIGRNEQLEQHIDQNNIVVVLYQDYKSFFTDKENNNLQAGHWSIIYGYDDESYKQVDSGKHGTALGTIEKDKLLSNWVARFKAVPGTFDHYGLVIPVRSHLGLIDQKYPSQDQNPTEPGI